MSIKLTKTIPERLALRTTKEDREHIASIAKDMLARGQVFVNHTDVIREALRKASQQQAPEGEIQ